MTFVRKGNVAKKSEQKPRCMCEFTPSPFLYVTRPTVKENTLFPTARGELETE